MRSFVVATVAIALLLAAVAVHAQPPPNGKVTSIPLLPSGVEVSSYSGYFTVDTATQSNLFFWLFEAMEADPTTAPLLIWLNGGPGSSSMYGLFTENGPFAVSEDGKSLEMRKTHWATKYNVMYIDNPVGTGFSYTQSPNGFVTNQKQVGQDLLSLLNQFYTKYPQFQKNELYICGESYAGKYVPAFSYAIHEANAAFRAYVDANPHWRASPRHSRRVDTASAAEPVFSRSNPSPAPFNVPNGMEYPLVGLSIGDGSMDPETQIPGYGSLLYSLSMIDEEQRAYMESVEQRILMLMREQKYVEAFRLFDPLMMSDIFPYPSYYNNVTGLTDYFNFLSPVYPTNDFDTYLNRADVKAALHVAPDFTYVSGNTTVEEYLLADWMQSIKPWLVTLLDSYRVLIYNGQNDIILSGPSCQNFLNTLEWRNSQAWHTAPRQVWRIDATDYAPAGYVKRQQTPVDQPGLTYAIVRDAGHLVPQDQPERAFDLISRFVDKKSFSN